MQYKQIDNELYTKIMQSHPGTHFPIEQSPEWGAFQSKVDGRQHLGVFLATKTEQQIAIFSFIQLDMRGWSYIWCNQGPVWLTQPTTELNDELATIMRKAAQELNPSVLFVRVHTAEQPSVALPAYSKTLVEKTTIVDLTKPFDDVLAAMSQGARRGMRKAQKAGVIIKEIPASEAAQNFTPYYDILTETADRDGFSVHPEATYKHMLTELGEAARFFVAFTNDKPIAWALDTVYQQYGIYYYGASNSEARANMAPYLLHIEIMRQFQQEGVKSYDFLGIGSKNYPGLQGVTQFKLRFGGDVIDNNPIFDIPLKPLKYKLWKIAQTAKSKLR